MTKRRPRCVSAGCSNLSKRRTNGSFHPLCNSCYRKKYNIPKKRYHQFKKTYCENTDGRLGFICTTTIHDPCMLSVDHWDSNKSNNTDENCVTLCAACHNYKTKLFKDYRTKPKPKRKSTT